jgi:hypothetical protein
MAQKSKKPETTEAELEPSDTAPETTLEHTEPIKENRFGYGGGYGGF